MKDNQIIEGPVLSLDRGASNEPGQMYMANEARYVEANFSEPLTTYAIGWRDPNNIEAALDFVAPRVQTTRRFEYAEFTNVEEFLSEGDDIRAIGGDFKRVEYTSKKTTSKTYNKGLTIRVDLDNVDGQPNWREIYTGRLMRRLLRNEYRRAVALLAAVPTGGNATTPQWKPGETAASGDPDQDVATVIITFQDIAGVPPNRVLYDQLVWNYRRINHRAQNTAGGFASAGMSAEDVAGFLGVDSVYVSKERYQSLPTTKARFTSGILLVFLAEANQSPEDPSNIKRFTSPTIGGTPFRVYEQQINAKLVDITIEHYSNIVVTSTLGVQKITPAWG